MSLSIYPTRHRVFGNRVSYNTINPTQLRSFTLKEIPDFIPLAWIESGDFIGTSNHSSHHYDSHYNPKNINSISYDMFKIVESFYKDFRRKRPNARLPVRGVERFNETLIREISKIVFREYLRSPIQKGFSPSEEVRRTSSQPILYHLKGFFTPPKVKRLKNADVIVGPFYIGDRLGNVLASVCVRKEKLYKLRIHKFLKLFKPGSDTMEQPIDSLVVVYDPIIYETNGVFRSIGTNVDNLVKSYPMEKIPMKWKFSDYEKKRDFKKVLRMSPVEVHNEAFGLILNSTYSENDTN